MPTTDITQPEIDSGLLFPNNYWNPAHFTFSVPVAGSSWAYSNQPSNGYSVLSAAQATGFAYAMDLWDRLIDPDFTQLTEPGSVGNIRVAFTSYDMGGSTWGYATDPPFMGGGPTAMSGDIWISSTQTDAVFEDGQFDLSALLHEIGHAIGLDHPFEGAGTLPAEFDNQRYTVMSYTDLPQGILATFSDNGNNGFSLSVSFDRIWAATPMVLDVAAIQSRYGADPDTNSGDTTYAYTDIPDYLWTIYDAGGTDTLDFSALGRLVMLDLRPGAYSSVGFYSMADQRAAAEAAFNPFNFTALTDAINDAIDADHYTWTNNMGIAFSTTIENAIGTAFDDEIIGNDVGNVLTGGDGDDTIDGGSNVDTAIFSGNFASYTITNAGSTATVVGADGTDTLMNVEFFQFDDQTFHWRPGTGQLIDFGDDPDTFMSQIRDFDGNDLGGSDGWRLAGMTDLQGDEDIEYIFFNRDIGRWASVGPAEDGLVYFDDHGWAGDTRVVGIYIDPLVESGDVEAGSDHDSQRRFQNDLFIDNIAGILGADDYDGDGLQEVYFSLTDGTAYLHAYMHADGNIRYANYQNQQQVIDFLTDNGWSSDTWDGWFPAESMLVASPDDIVTA